MPRLVRRHALPVVFAALVLCGPGCVRRVALVPHDGASRVATAVPAGAVEVDFVSDDEDRTWNVVVGGEGVCTTPCTRQVGASQELTLESSAGERVFLPALAVELPAADRAVIIAQGTHGGLRTNGIVFTSLGGMALVTAIPLLAIGCSNLERRGGMCVAGLITGGVALPLTLVSIWMILAAAPTAHVLPIASTPAGPGALQLRLGPTGLLATF